MKYVVFFLALLAISSNTLGATGDRFNGYPIVFCDDSTQSCKNIARSDAQRVANLGGTPHTYYYGLNFSTAVLARYQMSVYREPGLSIVTASDTRLDSYARSYANGLENAFDELNESIEDTDLTDVLNVADTGFSIEFSFFRQAYADPLECPKNEYLMSASDFMMDNGLRTRLFQEDYWLSQKAYTFMSKANELANVIDFKSGAANALARLVGALFDFSGITQTFPNGDRATVSVDPHGKQFIVVEGTIIDCNGQLYPEEIEPNTEFEFSTTESLHDFARYYGFDDAIRQYDIPVVTTSEYWKCRASSDGVVLVGRDVKGRHRGSTLSVQRNTWTDSRGTFFAAATPCCVQSARPTRIPDKETRP